MYPTRAGISREAKEKVINILFFGSWIGCLANYEAEKYREARYFSNLYMEIKPALLNMTNVCQNEGFQGTSQSRATDEGPGRPFPKATMVTGCRAFRRETSRDTCNRFATTACDERGSLVKSGLFGGKV